MKNRVRLAAATRYDLPDFWRHSLLGQSLLAMSESLRPSTLMIRSENVGSNVEGLSTFYNRALDACSDDELLVLVHDDVYLHDGFFVHRVEEALGLGDVAGVAGSSGGEPDEPSWALSFDAELEPLGWQTVGQRSGAVSHLDPRRSELARLTAPPVEISEYGPFEMYCNRLDGVLLMLHVRNVRQTGVRFDERFAFHLYDIDFCRQADMAGLDLITHPVLITHASPGNFGTPAWKDAARLYRQKWSAS